MQAICDFVHGRITFDYMLARATRTTLEAFNERIGVYRDFAHLAVTLCRCLNIPARYVNPDFPEECGFPCSEGPNQA